ncbi:FitA-like ribbon-helix-helix domain-containing protein [Nocardioides sp. Iso805N]|uniref:FitA-like ribbon-helix-helix domain-containing protein n=1 Tax=Nocardioides sp. Iso805N TaxID=1283287 RepID=UPI00038181CB|nr:Arc family DNA-binding protein [Nocardioides sp. Iso805N]
MPALHIRNVPEETVALLKERAARHGRSLEAELRAILGDAAAAGEPRVGISFGDRIVMATSDHVGPWTRDDYYRDVDPDGR